MKRIIQILLLILFVKGFSQGHKLHSVNTQKKFFVIEETSPKQTQNELNVRFNKYIYAYDSQSFEVKGDDSKIFNPDNNQMYYLKTSFIRAKRPYSKSILDIHIYESSKKEQFIIYLPSNQVSNQITAN
ncbi:hypothetical protein [Aquimarina macrocephali]|uniref:hypothetical protein n=1 Tax=Aquimarina macrocephali TaxID=666563 RepID=UPI003F66C2D4